MCGDLVCKCESSIYSKIFIKSFFGSSRCEKPYIFLSITMILKRSSAIFVFDYMFEYRQSNQSWNKRRKRGKNACRRGTLFIQKASIPAISHRLDSDRFEPLYAYRPETMLQWIKPIIAKGWGIPSLYHVGSRSKLPKTERNGEEGQSLTMFKL